MDISSFATKASLIKGGATLSGLSSASLGGYCIYDWMNPWTKLKDLSPSGSVTPPLKHKCFTTLSFNADFPANMSFSSPTNLEGDEFTPKTPTDTSGSGTTKGCTIMKKKNKGDTDWEFESGTLIKDDKYGIFVSFELNSKREGNSRFQAYFFEKNDAQWEIKTGFISSFGGNADNAVKTPDGSFIKVEYSSSSNSLTYSGSYSYSGIWTENSGETESLLFDGVFKNLTNDSRASYLSVIHIYDDGKIKQGSEGDTRFNKECLNKWLSLFKDKRGKWTASSS